MENLAKTQILPYIEGLAKKGMKISILSFEKRHNLQKRLQVQKLEKRLLNLNIKWIKLLHHGRWGNFKDIFAGFITAWRIVKKRHISIIHARADIPVIIAWPLAKIMKLKLIFDRRSTMREYYVDGVNEKNIFSINIFSHMLDVLDKFIIRHSNATIVLSEKCEQALRKNPYLNKGENIFRVIPCCTDLTKFSQNKSKNSINQINLKNKFVMTYLGSLGTCYLLEEMARFYKVLNKKNNNAFFYIISNVEREFIDNILIKENLLSGKDYTIICAKPEEVPIHLSISDCSIMFIKPSDTKIGSSPTKFGESLAAGVPIIINRGIGDTEDIIRSQKVGILVDSFSELAYDKAIEDLFSLLRKKEILKERCKKTAQNFFSLSIGISRYAEVYEKLSMSI